MKTLKLFLMLTAVIMCLFVSSCSEDDDDLNVIHPVVIKDNGETSNGTDFEAIDSVNFYLDHIKYRIITDKYLSVYGYDKSKFTGTEKIVSVITYKGKTYTTNSISNEAFKDCKIITELIVPDSVRFISSNAFHGCTELVSIKVSPTNPYLDSRNNCNAVIDTKKKELMLGCKTTVIPYGVTSIGQGAFMWCEGIVSLDIPSSVTAIGSYAYARCDGLTTIEIPNSIQTIGSYAFSSCKNVKSITIGENVEEIYVRAFDTNSMPKEIHCKATIPPMCYSGNTFNAWDKVFNMEDYYRSTLYVPKGTRDAYDKSMTFYKTFSDWGGFQNIIEE